MLFFMNKVHRDTVENRMLAMSTAKQCCPNLQPLVRKLVDFQHDFIDSLSEDPDSLIQFEALERISTWYFSSWETALNPRPIQDRLNLINELRELCTEAEPLCFEPAVLGAVRALKKGCLHVAN